MNAEIHYRDNHSETYKDVVQADTIDNGAWLELIFEGKTLIFPREVIFSFVLTD
jgi:hypothetical protein